MKDDSHKLKELNNSVKCTIGVSKIHGVGIIALRNIKEGEELHCKGDNELYEIPYEKFSKIKPYIRKIILERHPMVIKGHPFLSPNGDARMISFMNHGEGEDCNYDKFTDTAIRVILKGDEVLEDYGEFKTFK